MALNPNAWEAVGRRIDQQLYYLNNLDQKKFLGQLFKTDVFNGKGDTSFSKEMSSYIKEMLNTVFNRGVSRTQVAMINSKNLKGINNVIQNVKPLYVGSVGNSFGHLAATVSSMAAMTGNPLRRFQSFAEGWTYIPQFANPESPMNTFMDKYANEVYNRGLANYQIPMAKAGNLISKSISANLGDIAGLHSSPYASDSFVKDFTNAIRDKNLMKAIQVAALMFNTKMAARISFIGLYHNYCRENNIKIDYDNPDLKGIDFALKGTRDTNHTSSDLFQSGLSKGIIPDSRMFTEGEAAVVGDILFSSILGFKQFANNQNRYLNMQVFALKTAIREGDTAGISKATQSIMYARAGQMMFHAIRTAGQTICYALPIALAFSGGDLDKAKRYVSKETKGAFNVGNLFAKSCFDNFVMADAPSQLVSQIAQKVEEKGLHKTKLEDWEKKAYPYDNNEQGGLVFSLMEGQLEMGKHLVSEAFKPKDKKEPKKELYTEYAQEALLWGTMILGPNPAFGADLQKILNETKKHTEKPKNQTPITF
jgi:hypothetical protein